MDSPHEKSFAQRIQEKLAASRFFTFSMLLHVILVIMGGSVVLFKQYTEPPDFVSSEGGLLSTDTSVQPPPEEPPDMSQQFTPEAPSVVAPTINAITTTATNPTNFQMASVPVMKPVGEIKTNLTEMPRNVGNAAGKGLPGTMGGRKGGTERMAAIKKMGGKEKSEKAVMAGLRWLKKTQNADGSWAPEHKPAMTGLALLCFLGHGELPESPEFGPTVKKALDWVLEKGTAAEGRMHLGKEFNQPGVYEHGILAYAIGEYYTMTKDERFAELVKMAMTHIVQGQAPDGGWQYGYEKGPDSDTSVTGWQIQALKAAHLTGLAIPGVDEALDKAMLNLKRVQSDNGNFGYRKKGDRGDNPSLVGVGVLCTYFWKQDKDRVVRDGIEFLLKKAESDHPVSYKGEKADLYAWYYNTQACLMYGGSAWTKWNRMFQDEIADNQGVDGSWPPTGGKGHGENEGGKAATYRTTLCILMLEVFYRYMPTTK